MSREIKIKRYHKYYIFILSVAILYILLLIPTEGNLSVQQGSKKPFVWNLDSLWNNLESEFIYANKSRCDKIKFRLDSLLIKSKNLLNNISSEHIIPSDNKFKILETNIFEIAPLIPVCKQYFPEYITFYSNLRNIVKEKSKYWDMNSIDSRNTLYRLLYGNRTAIEEIMLQLPQGEVSTLIKGTNEPSSTPSVEIRGIHLHSGDILVSRGGAATSALIARGNDYPGNFSHIALVHIDAKTKLVSIVESHIEKGVTISSLDEYFGDKKLRIMILRIRSEMIKDDPLLPHKAAEYSLHTSQTKHIQYDFEMNLNETEKQFCSEVASSAYKKYGIKLWSALSNISSIGTRKWLAAFGVKYFETQEPSDLEYDPQLSVIAEWRDPQTLLKDHMDNAITDVMLEEADRGKDLTYDWYMLPIGRVMKLYSIILNLFGSVGPIPEGMSVEAALRNLKYSAMHDQIKEKLILLAEQFKADNGYMPPYWDLVNLARQACFEINQ